MTDKKPVIIDRQLAKDVAKHVDRRQVRRKLVLWGALITAIIIAVLYGTCGSGWGLGKGKGDGSGAGAGSNKPLVSTVDAGPQVCTIVISAAGITVNGVPAKRDEAVAQCQPVGRAEVIVAGDTVQGNWDDLKAALDAAGIQVFKRESKTEFPDAGAK
jgi:hypothetical protein